MAYKHVPVDDDTIKIIDDDDDELDITNTGRAKIEDYSGNLMLCKIIDELKKITKELKKINSKG